MTDEMLMDLIAADVGFSSEDPFRIKTTKGVRSIDDDIPDSGRFVSLDKYTSEEKMNDADYINTDDL